MKVLPLQISPLRRRLATLSVTAQASHAKGFTLIELIIVIAIMAILLTIAVPSFQDMMKRNSISSQQNELVTTLNYARSEAVSRSKAVTVCMSDDGADCGAANSWTDGWIVFVDEDGDGVMDAGDNDDVLRIHSALGSSNSLELIAVGNADNESFLQYNNRGLIEKTEEVATVTAAAFTLCESGDDTAYARAVILSATGRAYRSRDTNASGVHNGSGATDLAC